MEWVKQNLQAELGLSTQKQKQKIYLISITKMYLLLEN
jgi:hypothetical protein